MFTLAIAVGFPVFPEYHNGGTLWRVTRNRWLWWRCYSNPASGGLMWSRQRGRKAGSRHHRTPQNHETASERRQKRHFSRAAHATTNRYPEDMHTELRVTLPGPQGSADARRALAVLDRLLNLLGYIEDSVLDKPALRADERSSWGFSSIQLGSLTAPLSPSIPRRGATKETLGQVAGAVVKGFAETEQHHIVPEGWSIRAANTGVDLANLLAAVTGRMDVELLRHGQVVRAVSVTQRTARNLARALSVQRRSLGSVIGRLDSISVHKRRLAGVWDSITGLRVEVTFTDNQVQEIKNALGKRVEIFGLITRDF